MPARLCVCESCGQTVVEGEPPAVVGYCRLCRAMDEAIQQNTRRRELRAIDKRRSAGYGPPAPGVDLFAGFRED